MSKIRIGMGSVLLFFFGWFGWQYVSNPNTINYGPVEKICFVGDTGKVGAIQTSVVKAMKKEDCKEVFFLGDIIYPVGLEFIDDPQLNNKFRIPYSDFTKFVAIGNHDAYSKEKNLWLEIGEKYDDIYYPNHFYTVKFGDVCVLAFNSNVYNTMRKGKFEEAQNKYIRAFTERADCEVTITSAHHPCLSSGKHGNAKGRMKKFCEQYLYGRVDIIMAGHDHILSIEHQKQGTYSFVSGSGSKVRDCNEVEGTVCYAEPGFFVYNSKVKREMTMVLTEK